MAAVTLPLTPQPSPTWRPEDAANLSHTLSHELDSGSRILSTASQTAATNRIGVDTGNETRFLFQCCLTSNLVKPNCFVLF